MFHVLHRIVVGLFFLFLAGVAWFIYEQRAVFNPVADFSTALMIRKDSEPNIVSEVTGLVTKVADVTSFQLKSAEGQRFHVRMGGLAFPAEVSTNKFELALRDEADAKLRGLILSNQVHVSFTFVSEQRAGVGMVYLGETNVNAIMVEAGLAKPKKQYLKGLTLKQLYALVRAERAARENERGIWRKEPETIVSSQRF